MTERSRRVVVVTGASSGIGAACVASLVQAGFFVFGAVRKAADAERLTGRFGDGFAPLFFDVSDAQAIGNAAHVVESRLQGATLAGLVNNAGVAVAGPLLHLPIEDFGRQLDINLTGQLRVTQAFAPLLGARQPSARMPGRIVMMSSISGLFAAPFLGAYCASKFAIEGMSDALRHELKVYGIDVVLIEPGMIATSIWDKADGADFAHFETTIYGGVIRQMRKLVVAQERSAPGPEIVAAAVLRALTAPRAPLRIPVMRNRFLGWTLPGLMPMRLVDWVVDHRLGLSALRRELAAACAKAGQDGK